MKQIMCPTCKREAVGTNDEPITMGYFSGGRHPIVVKCKRCMNAFKLMPGDFHRLPDVVAKGA